MRKVSSPIYLAVFLGQRPDVYETVNNRREDTKALFWLTICSVCNTILLNAIQTGGEVAVPLSLRISPEKEKMIQKASRKAGKTKSAFIIDAVDEKLGISKNREQTIRRLAGWLSHEEAEELRNALEPFSRIHEGDWP